MFAKVVVVLIFLGILVSLGSGLVFMLKDDADQDRMVKALTFRIGISVGLFALLFVMWFFGWIEPHGIGG